ncbi:MAG: topoisomerase DNA-binding C4 zinc finger domain-containing protein, partial [Deltaproteobacteria bacterium]|nr:topoisomerase DNA-binding C4 zinc finger domain-containing protein [Deltaproteobacteria bacterium]
KGRLFPTELGCLVTDLLVENFRDIFDVQFTAQMEDDLDKVEEGQLPWVRVLKDFYDPFQKDLEKAKVEMQDMKAKGVPTEYRCEKCEAPMVIKLGRHGQFLACSNYPQCKNTKEFQRNESGQVAIIEEKPVEETCEKCGAPMTIKMGRFGKFLACSNYPQCKNTKKISPGEGGKEAGQSTPTGESCPQCGEPLVNRKGRFGLFIACSNYPKCRYTQKGGSAADKKEGEPKAQGRKERPAKRGKGKKTEG